MDEAAHSAVGRFTSRVDEYVAARPSYPSAAIDAVFDGYGRSQSRSSTTPSTSSSSSSSSQIVVADIGAGTGISAQLFAERGARVIAIEPNEAMRGAIVPSALIEVRDGTAERTGLAEGSIDIIVCAQAYHWFEPASACAEFGRVLRPGGRLVLMWNDPDDASPVSSKYIQLVCDAGEIESLPHRLTAKAPPIHAPFGNVRGLTVPNEQRMTADGLLVRAQSASYVPKSGARWESLKESLNLLHAENADASGLVRFGYVTRVWIAERIGP
jgi:SAM-dependent methyltransferase